MINGSFKIGTFACRSWEHKSSSPPLGLSSHFVQTGWKTLFILLILSHYIFLSQMKPCYAAFLLNYHCSHLTISLPMITVITEQVLLVGFNLFLKNTGLVMWNKVSSSVYLLLYKIHKKGYYMSVCACMHVCSSLWRQGNFSGAQNFQVIAGLLALQKHMDMQTSTSIFI